MRLLFIGNSHTFVNGLPFQVRELLRQGGLEADTTMFATGGVTLGWHAEQVETRMALKYNAWDWVILQQKTHPFDGYPALRQDYLTLAPYIPKSARVTLYMTWAEKRFPQNADMLDDAFTRVAKETGATLSPVSKAWRRICEAAPEIDLYQDDGEHASQAGSYLAACVFYTLISGRSPEGMPERIYLAGDELANLPGAHARRLQVAAWQAMTSSKERPGGCSYPESFAR